MNGIFPFSAVVGQDDLGLALCLAVVSPEIGGVLVRGEKGTAKSTMVRGLASVLPPIEVVDGDRFGCDPADPDPSCPDLAVHDRAPVSRPVSLVELPVGATEDRVVGALHLDRLVGTGEVAFEPGLLARAHRGLLYVDEVNLLPDHLVDSLLDAAAMGRARVEREAVSVTHAARFVLVGTMNPEEGELRPQLLDRFGLAVDVTASRDPELRVEVIRSRLAFEADPASFVAKHETADRDIAARITAAQALLDSIRLPDAVLVQIATLCAAYDVDGLRGDLVTARTAIAHAAWCGRAEVTSEDVRVAARLALPHRRRRNPFDDHDSGTDLERLLDEHAPDDPEDDPDGGPDGGPDGRPDGGSDSGPDGGSENGPEQNGGEETGGPESTGGPPPPPDPSEAQVDADKAQLGADGAQVGADKAQLDADGAQVDGEGTRVEAGTPYAARLLQVDRVGQGVTGRRSTAQTVVGRHLRAVPLDHPQGQGIHAISTVLAAAADRARRDPAVTPAGQDQFADRARRDPLSLQAQHLRRSLRQGKEGNLVVFVVDTSGSMGAARRVREVKTAVVSLLLDAYQRRDKVAVVTFSGARATVALEPTSSVDRAERMLAEVPTGGRTPLAEALVAADAVVRRERARDPQRRPLVVLITDGRATAGPGALARARRTAGALADHPASWVVVDAEAGAVRLGLARDLAVRLGAEHLPMGDVGAATIAGLVRDRVVAPGATSGPGTTGSSSTHRRGVA
ncbi:magnesium chelatase subunit D family protein [Nocardioides limicola]|uniref:magnesium chelatase subunit D family protein n=1 Tax=Nocardioides limicola TaxID=2803368 RepID=UPI0027DB5F7F|nr:magnesium chelatase subunit D family protein [Nocardioides sp. DJM-14]